jgi:hypothetical protein
MEAKILDFSTARRTKVLTGSAGKPREITDVDRMLLSHNWGERITRENTETLHKLLNSYATNSQFCRFQDPEFYMDADKMIFTYVEIMESRSQPGEIYKYTFEFAVDEQTAVINLKRQETLKRESGTFRSISTLTFP